jgi:flagellar protein FliO/FliZ
MQDATRDRPATAARLMARVIGPLVALLLAGAAPPAAPELAPTELAPAPIAAAPVDAAATQAAAHAPVPPDSPPFGEPDALDGGGASGALRTLIRMALALGAVLLLVYLLLHKGLGALSGRLAKGRLVRVVDRVGLEPKKALYVVEVAGRYFLIGTADHGVSCLAALDHADTKAAFEDLLRVGAQQGKAPAAKPAAGQGGKDD